MNMEARIEKIKAGVESSPDFPKPGILFRDLFPVMRDPILFKDLIALLVEHLQQAHPDVEAIIGLDARGFIFGPLMAQQMGIAFVPVRKKGKLPGEVFRATYEKEYGEDILEIQRASVKTGQKVVIVDDLIATGGTMAAALQLLEAAGADVLECLVVIELDDLKGQEKLSGKPFHALIHY